MTNKLKKVVITSFMVGFILGLWGYFQLGLRAEDNKTGNRWTTQLLYDTTNVCYQGTYRWILMANPALIGQTPPIAVQRQMVEHCFCIIDKLRHDYTMGKYVKFIQSGSQVEELFMSNAYKCMKEFDTMKGIFLMPNQLDNSTKTDNETTIIPDQPKDSKEESPDQPKKESNGIPETIFQG